MDESLQEQASTDSSPIQAAEKTIPVSQVNEIVKREKREAAERERKRVEAEFEAKMADIKSSIPQSIGGMSQNVSEDRIKSLITDQLKAHEDQYLKQQQQREMEQIADRYFSKMSQGKDKFEDFDTIMADFDPKEFPAVAFMAADLDNAAEVMYELAKNPGKLADIETLVTKSPKMAQRAMKNLADSIATNKAAKESYNAAPAPLTQSRPSLNSGLDASKMGISDLRKLDWLRR